MLQIRVLHFLGGDTSPSRVAGLLSALALFDGGFHHITKVDAAH